MNRRNLLQLAVLSPLALTPLQTYAFEQAQIYWQEILALIKPELPLTSVYGRSVVRPWIYENFFLPTKVLSVTGNEITLQLPELPAAYILLYHDHIIEDARKKVCPGKNLCFTADSEGLGPHDWQIQMHHHWSRPVRKSGDER
jgi:hypothetical protein